MSSRKGGRGRSGSAPSQDSGDRSAPPRRPGNGVAAPAPLQGAWSRRGESVRAAGAGDVARVTERVGQLNVQNGCGQARSVAPSQGRGSGSHQENRNGYQPEVPVRTRPDNITKKGTTGRAVTFTTNYFRFATKPDWCLYQYSVEFSHEENRTFIRRMLMRDHKDKLGAYIFDGSVMFVSHRLNPSDNTKPVTFTSIRRSDDTKINITCQLVGDVMYGNPQYLQFFNLIFRNFMGCLDLQMVKRDYYDAKNKISVDEVNMDLWPGYQTSIRQHEQEVLLCAEITHKVMKRDTILDVLSTIARQDRDYKTAFSRAVVGTVVLTQYNNRTYRIDDVDWAANPNSTFQKGDKKMTYMDYMWEKYQIRIRDPRQPMLVSKSRPREVRAGQSDVVYLIPEVCRCTGLTDNDRANFRVMQELAKHTRLNPANRIRALLSFIKRLSMEPRVQDNMRTWQMSIPDQLMAVKGRILQDEDIYFGGNKTCRPSADWMKSMQASPYINTVPLKNWVVIFPERCARETERFVGDLKFCGKGMNFVVPDPIQERIRDDSAGSFVHAIGQVLDRQRPQIVLCIVTNKREDRYNAIKKICYVDRGVPSQVVTVNVATKGKSVATKVILQMACKIGCIPWQVQNPIKGTMIVGFDVCHDSTRKELSYGALVASTNDTIGSYYSCASEHQQGQEVSTSFPANVIKAVKEWERQNKAKPSRIIIYRDGVGDGDFNYVLSTEVELVKKQLVAVYGNADLVKLAFIIVNKRIKTRYFLDGNNPPPGSVIDDVITLPERYDFYLVSQHVGQGTVSPTSYNIIHDTTGLKADHIQRLTYKLTHMYFNWPGPVRVPAPCQYAHKLAFLVGQSLHRTTSHELENTLYYL